jgi:hypothetical protein
MRSLRNRDNTPKWNGVTERLNRTLLERIHAFTHLTGLPKMLWGEVLQHATWLKNRMVTHTLEGKMPYKALHSSLPNVSTLYVWGCIVWVHDPTGLKLDACACKRRWLGFDVELQAHHVYWPNCCNVSVERSVYFGLSAQLEGEELLIPVTIPRRRAGWPDCPEQPVLTKTWSTTHVAP